MYKFSIFLFLSIFTLSACNDDVKQKALNQTTEMKLVKEAFIKYKTAVLSQDGYEAMKCLNQNTIDYYDDILNKIKLANKEEISMLSAVDQMQVVSIRYIFPKEEIFNLTGITLYAAMIREGLMDVASLKTITIGHVSIKGNKGKAQMITNGQKTPIFIDFSKEDKLWKIDLATSFIITTKHLENKAKQSQKPTLDYLLDMLNVPDEDKTKLFIPLK